MANKTHKRCRKCNSVLKPYIFWGAYGAILSVQPVCWRGCGEYIIPRAIDFKKAEAKLDAE